MTWLDRARERGKHEVPEGVVEEPVQWPDRVLRGVKFIDPVRLKAARSQVAVNVGEGRYVVASEKTLLRAAKITDLNEFWTFLNTPRFVRRRTEDLWTGEMVSVEDLDGWNSYVVDLNDPYVEPCECRDLFYDATQEETVCKHILAALIAEGHEGVSELSQGLLRDDAIAAALRKPREDD